MSWPRAHKLLLFLGISLWALAATLTPGELTAAKRREKIGARTAVTLVAYLAAAICVLRGLPVSGSASDRLLTSQNTTPKAAAPPPGSGTAPNETRGPGA